MNKTQNSVLDQKETNKLNKKLFAFVSKKEIENQKLASLEGKEKSVTKDVFIRFFKSKWNIIFLAIFLVLVFLVFVGPCFNSFSANERISDASLSSIQYMPPPYIDGWNIGYETTLDPVEFETLLKVYSGEIISQGLDEQTGFYYVEYYDPNKIETWLGTDNSGADVWTKLLTAGRNSLILAFTVTAIEFTIGIVIGMFLGFNVGKRIDTIFMRFIEIISAIPSLLLMILLSLIIGGGFWAAVFIFCVTGWVSVVYLTRMHTMRIKDSEFILAARSSGLSTSRILFIHVLPNITGRLLVSFVHRIPGIIFFETTLIFLGIDIVASDSVYLGRLIEDSRSLEAIEGNPMFIVSISTFLLLLTFSLQIISNGLRDAFIPKTGEKR